MTIESKTDGIITLKGDGTQLNVDVIDLFAPMIGGDPINVQTVLQLLRGKAEKDEAGFQPNLPQALDVLEKAGNFYDIQFGHKGKPGYSVVKAFSGVPVIFENKYSRNRVGVDPKDVQSSALQNSEWVRLPSKG